MKHYSAILFSVMLMLLSCSSKHKEHDFYISGTWTLHKVENNQGETVQYPDNGIGYMRIYDDSCFYECQMLKAPNGTMVAPGRTETYTLMKKTKGDYIYLQADGTHPLTTQGDSIMVIQEIGRKYTWKRGTTLDTGRIDDVIGIIKSSDTSNDSNYCRYVFSDAERDLQSSNHTLLYVLMAAALALLLIIHYSISLFKNKKRVEHELQLIEQERQAMPEPVRAAMSSVEDDFHNSDLYVSLRKKLSNGTRLSQHDWDSIENSFKSVYPRFTSTLITLHNMSAVELQVCYLIKLNASPSEIANVLSKDTSTVSSIRSRLYMKVFGKKGSSKDWDEFIRSL